MPEATPPPAPAANGPPASPAAQTPASDTKLTMADLMAMPGELRPGDLPEPPEDIAPADEPAAGETPEPSGEADPGTEVEEPVADPDEPQAPAPNANGKPVLPAGLEGEDAEMVKQMSRPAREYMAKRLAALKADVAVRETKLQEVGKELEIASGKRLPDAWYSQKGAHVLSPEYQEVEKQFFDWQDKTAGWTDLLTRYEAGELKWNGKSFDLMPEGEEHKPDPRVKRMLEDRRQSAYEQQKSFADKANKIEESFNAQYQAAEKHVTDGMAKFFPWMIDEKHASQPAFKKILLEFPEPFRAQPTAKFAAAMVVEYIALRAKMAGVQTELEGLKKRKGDGARVPPVPGRGARATNRDASEKKMTLADFQ